MQAMYAQTPVVDGMGNSKMKYSVHARQPIDLACCGSKQAQLLLSRVVPHGSGGTTHSEAVHVLQETHRQNETRAQNY